jgi:hypothetical protein
MLSFRWWCPHMKLTKMILHLILGSTKGHLGYKLCKDICYNVGIWGFPTVYHMISNHTCRLHELTSVSVLKYTDLYHLEIWIFSTNTRSVNSLTNFTCTHMHRCRLSDGHWPTSWCVLADYVEYSFVKNPERTAHQAKAGCTLRCFNPIKYF